MTLPSRLGLKNGLDAWAALLVTLAPFIYFHQAVAGRLFLSPDDGVLFNIPLRMAAARVVLEGHLPLWNPYIFGGMPLHGAAQGGLLFPLNWFYLAFDAPAATNLMMLSTYAVAALGAYLYARRTGSSIEGSVLTSLAYQWSGFLVAQIGHTNVVQVAALLPWLLWAVDGYGATGKRGRGVVLAAVVMLQAFAGHQQTLVYSLLLAAAYALVMQRAARPARSWYLWSLVLLAAGMLLAAVQILPTYELMRNSVRAGTSYDFFSSFSLPPRFLLTFFAPYVLGGGDGALFRAPYTDEPYYGEYIGYVGLLTVMLAALAVALKKRDARTKFWAAAALVALALALGRNWPFKLYGVVYYVPVLNLFRVSARHMMEVDFALAVLAGRGLTALVADENRERVKKWALIVGASVALLTSLVVTVGRPSEFRLNRDAPVTLLRAPELFLPVALAVLSALALWRFARRRKRGAALLLLAVLALDLCLWGQSSGWRRSSPRPQSELWQGTAPVKFLRERGAQEAGLFRILTVWQSFDPAVPFDETQTPEANEYALQPDPYMAHGIQNAAGYDGFGLARYSRFADDMKVWGDVTDHERSLRGPGREFDLLGVRYLLTRPLLPKGQSRAASPPADAQGAAPSSTEAPGLPPPPATEDYGGQLFAAENLNVPPLDRGERLTFDVPRVAADRFALLTNLSWSVAVPDGTQVGSVRLRAEDGRTFDFALRAGEHTSEWAYDRADIRRAVRHRRAPVATSYAVEDAQGKYEGHTYLASFALPERVVITGGEIAVARYEAAPDLGLNVVRVSLADSTSGNTLALRAEWMKKASAPSSGQATQQATQATATPAAATPSASERWRRVAQAGNVLIYENTRAMPRAWLTPGAEVLDEQATLAAIRTGRLPGGAVWEPGRTALLEATPEGFSLSDANAFEGRAEVTRYEPNRVEVRTAADAPSVLVLAEN
ncbi:MAG TPA: YfhO family protein, partial [Pyrinomonadaceae bacterium]|nr:YfhO family protein [Pyrinomonadaceae bacterium]